MDVFDLFAKISLDTSEYDKGLDDASGKTKSFGEKLKSGLATAAKVGAATIVAASAAITAIATQSLNQYAQYEQLVGGVKTLFGTEAESVEEYAASVGKSVSEVQGEYDKLVRSQNTVMDNAANAFQTAGLSANEYMETVTSFSASLLQSLGGDTEKAAQYADTAITDMSDNANKMGTAMDSIQNAYQGFAKQNFTMLDNLKLGYGGTKEEMERLLADAEKLSGIEYDISSYADIVDAIHAVQTEMGITGTTAKEASTTVQGSIFSVRGAWENLLVGVADENAQLDTLIGNLVDSVTIAAENVVPRIQQILVGIGSAVEKLAPIIAEQLPEFLAKVLPSLLAAGASLVSGLLNGIVQAIPALATAAPGIILQLTNAIIENLPILAAAAVQVVTSLANGLESALPALIPVAVDAVLQMVQVLTEPSTLGNLFDAALAIILALADGLLDSIPILIDALPEIIINIVTALQELSPKLMDAAVSLILSLSEFLSDPNILYSLLSAANQIVEQVVLSVIKNAPKMFSAAGELITKLIDGITKNNARLAQNGREIVDQVKNGLMQKIRDAGQWGRDLMDNFIGGIQEKMSSLGRAVGNVASTVRDYIGFSEPEKGPLSDFHTYAPDMMELFAQGISQNVGVVQRQLDESLNFDFGTAALGVSPSASGFFATSSNGMAQPTTINITINGAKYTDEESLAQAISREIQRVTERRSAVYA